MDKTSATKRDLQMARDGYDDCIAYLDEHDMPGAMHTDGGTEHRHADCEKQRHLFDIGRLCVEGVAHHDAEDHDQAQACQRHAGQSKGDP